MVKKPSVRSFIMMSIRMRSGRSILAIRMPSGPLCARKTVKPLVSSKQATASTKSWSSSTINTRFLSGIVSIPDLVRLAPGRKAHPKRGADAGLAIDADDSTHFGNNLLGNMQTQAGSGGLLQPVLLDAEKLS